MSTQAERRKEWLAVCARMDEMCGGPEWRDRVIGGYRLGDGWAEFGLQHDPEKPPPRTGDYGVWQISPAPPFEPKVFIAPGMAAAAALRRAMGKSPWRG